jgi:hypothetical protein
MKKGRQKKGRREAGPKGYAPAQKGSLGTALLHAVHGLLCCGLRFVGPAHVFHRSAGDVVHHRAFVARWIEGDVELLRECGGDEANDKSGGQQVLLHSVLLG